MLIVIPVSAADANLIEPFSLALKHAGHNSGFSALVVARPSDQSHATSLVEALGGAFEQISTHIFPQDGPDGWPKGPNFYFSSTASYLESKGNTLPWFWMELDTTVLKPGWASALITEYNLAKLPFMGVIEKTHAMSSEGVPVDAGSHLVGVAVYPPNLSAYSTLFRFTPKMDKPFDVVCQWETINHTHTTKLLQHCFRTQEYALGVDGAIRGKDNNDFPMGIKFDHALSPDAFLHHGCDDGSLARLVVSGSGEKKAAKAQPQQKEELEENQSAEVSYPKNIPEAKEPPKQKIQFNAK